MFEPVTCVSLEADGRVEVATLVLLVSVRGGIKDIATLLVPAGDVPLEDDDPVENSCKDGPGKMELVLKRSFEVSVRNSSKKETLLVDGVDNITLANPALEG